MDTSAERQSAFRHHLKQNEFLSVPDACQLAQASPATIRRDFTALVAAGHAQRHRGGVQRVAQDSLAMVPFAERQMTMPAEKARIAAAAAALIQPGDVVFVDGGTSTLHLAEHLAAMSIRIITNSLRLAVVIGERNGPAEVHLSGGALLPRSGLLVGPQARAGLGRFHATWAFLSVSGLDATGIWNTDEFVAEVEQTMIANAQKTVVLADHTKLGKRALLHVAGLDRLDHLVTDHGADAHLLATLTATGLRVLPA